MNRRPPPSRLRPLQDFGWPHFCGPIFAPFFADANPDGVAKYAANFAQNNPGKVLVTAAATTLLVSRPEALLGGPDNPDGTSNPGFIERAFSWTFDRTIGPILTAALWIGIPFVAIFAVWKLYKVWWMDRHEMDAMTRNKKSRTTRVPKVDEE